jgi:hypothetical protein
MKLELEANEAGKYRWNFSTLWLNFHPSFHSNWIRGCTSKREGVGFYSSFYEGIAIGKSFGVSARESGSFMSDELNEDWKNFNCNIIKFSHQYCANFLVLIFDVVTWCFISPLCSIDHWNLQWTDELETGWLATQPRIEFQVAKQQQSVQSLFMFEINK